MAKQKPLGGDMTLRRALFAFGILLALSANAPVRAGDRSAVFNVRNYGAKGDAATDDSVAIASAATTAAATAASGRPARLYFPSGIYRLVTALPTFTAPVSVSGDGHAQSVILVDTAFSGDVFSWSETGREAGDVDNLGGPPESAGEARVEIDGIRIVGNRATTHVQNAFVFYDHADRVLMQNVDVFYMAGSALHSGVTQRTPQASMTRSQFYSLRFFNCGSAGMATVDFNSHGAGDGTSQVSVNALDIFAPFGAGVVIHSDGPPVHSLSFSKLRIEGLQNGTISSDLLQVGDAALNGSVSDIEFDQAELIDPYFGFAAIRFTAPGLPSAPHEIRYEGLIGGGLPNGKGVVIDAGRSLFLKLRGIHTTDVNVSVASSATVGGPIVLNGFGQESAWTRSIDASSAANVKKPVLQQF
jgi:Pectate lyase superfamily protein